MANREYFAINPSRVHDIPVDFWAEYSKEVEVSTWLGFGKPKTVTQTYTRHITFLSLYVYHERDKDEWYEFFTGEKLVRNGGSCICFESAQDVGIDFNAGRYGNVHRMTAENFANNVKPLMHHKGQIVYAIRQWIQEERDIAEKKRREAEAAKKPERDAESWLDSVLKNR